MAQYNRIPQTVASKPSLDSDSIDMLHNVPSHFDVALNGGIDRNFLSPAPAKATDTGLLDPEAFRRLSISTISSMTYSRGVSPLPVSRTEGRKAWSVSMKRWWVRNQGLVFVTLSQAFGALMNVTTRMLETEADGIGPFQVLFARMFLTTCFCLTWMWWKKVPDYPLGQKSVRKLLVARGMTGFFGIWGLYYSLQYLPVADAVVLTFLAPSLASYGCYLFLREPFPLSAQYASLVSLVGVVLITQPTTFFSSGPPMTTEATGAANSTSAYDAGLPAATPSERLQAVGAAMLGVFGAAGAFTTIRWIGKRAHVVISVNYFAVWCTIVSTFALTLAQPLHLSTTLHFTLPRNARQWSMLAFLGVCGFFTQFLLTKGLAVGGRVNGARATNMIYTQMIFAMALDKLVFGQSPGWWSLAGSGLILGSAIFVAMRRQDGDSAPDEAVVVAGTEDEEIGMLSLRGRREARGGEGVCEELGVI